MTSRRILGPVSLFVVICAHLALAPAAHAQGTSAASITGIVTDASGAVLPGVTVEASSPELIERVRATVTDEKGEYRIAELRPGTYTVTFTLPSFASYKREGLELGPSFTATVNAQLRVGAIEESVTVSGASPLVDTQNITHQTVIPKTTLDTLPTGKNLLSLYALTPAVISPTNAQDVGGSKGETSSRASVHGSKQGDTKMMLDGMSFNWFEGEGSGRAFYVNALTAQEVVVDTPGGSTSAEYTANGVVINLIPKDGGNRYSGTFFATGTDHNLQADNLTPELQAQGVRTTSGTRSIYDLNAVVAGPIVQDKVWFMSAHRRWGRREQVANLFHAAALDVPTFVPDYNNPGLPTEDFHSDNARVTWQINQKNKVNVLYEWQLTNQENNFAYLNSGVNSMESGSPYCNRAQLVMGTWTGTASNKLLFEGGFLYLNQWANTFEHACAGIPGNRLYRDPTISFPFNGNGPVQSDSGQIPFKQRFSMSYITGSHHFKTGMTADESLPRDTYTSRGPTPFTYTLKGGTPISLTEYASPSLTGEVKVRPDLGIFAEDQWTMKRVTLNLGLRYEYHRTYAAPVITLAGPLVDSHNLPGLDCIPCWHDLDPRLGVVWDPIGDGKTAVKASLGRYVGLVSWVMSKTFSPQSAIVSSASRSWTTTRPWSADLVPNCDLRNPAANGFGGDTCGPTNPQSFGQEVLTTTPDPNWIQGWGKRPYSWAGSVSIDRELRPGVAVTAAYSRTTFGNQTVTRNTDVNPSDYSSYCITAPVDPRLPANVSGQQLCGFYDINPTLYGKQQNVVTLASNYGNATEWYQGVDVNLVARLPHKINVSGGWNIGNAISTLQVWPGNVTSNSNMCFVVNSPQDQNYISNNGALTGCATKPPYQNLFKVNGSVGLPWDFQAAGVFQSIPGPNYDAIYTATTQQIAQTLHRPLAGGVQTIQINLVQPLSQYADYRINQFDVRLTKILRMTRGRIQLNLDVYNALNGSYVLWGSTIYGTNGSNWRNPTSTLDARLFKFGVQYDF